MRLASAAIDGSTASQLAQLGADEQLWLASMTDRERARARAHAWALARRLLGSTPPVSYAPDGRPRLAGSGLDVSFSHSRERVMVGAVEQPARIGVDVASLSEPIDTARFLRRIASRKEYPLLHRFTREGWTLRSALILLWSLKEAAAKCSGDDFVPGELQVMEAAAGVARIVNKGRNFECGYTTGPDYVECWAVLP